MTSIQMRKKERHRIDRNQHERAPVPTNADCESDSEDIHHQVDKSDNDKISSLKESSLCDREWLASFMKLMINCTLLVEYIIALFLWGSDKFGDQLIFWIFFVYGTISSIITNIHCNIPKWINSMCLMIPLQVIQAVLFMYICEWTIPSIIAFSVILNFQMIFECMAYFIMKTSDNFDEDIYEEHWVGITFCSCFYPVLSGLSLIPYLHFEEVATFPMQWFQIYTTMITCFAPLSI